MRNEVSPLGTLLAWIVLAAAICRAASAAGVPCNVNCTARGNCNADDGTCQCKWGWQGSACERPLFPACHTTEDERPHFGFILPKNCACYNQVRTFYNCTGSGNKTCDLFAFAPPFQLWTCYTYKNVPLDRQRSIMPPVNASNVEWKVMTHRGVHRAPIPDAEGRLGADWWRRPMLHLPTEECRALQGCNHPQGFCVKVHIDPSGRYTPVDWNRHAPECLCQKGYKGATCNRTDDTLCPNRCHGRGKCIVGFCHCAPPYFGADCGRSQAAPEHRAQGNHPTRATLSIYVYELPHWLSSPIELDDTMEDRGPAYMTYEHMQAQLLADWSVRTEDPYRANLFYVPAHTFSHVSNLMDPSAHVHKVLTYVSHHWPFFNRSSGRDHVLWYSGDRGGCRYPTIATNVIKLTKFGYHVNMVARPEANYLRPVPVDPHNACASPLRDVVVPPHCSMGGEQAAALYKDLVAHEGRSPLQTRLFFFAGSVRPHDPAYGGGARAAVAKLVTHLNQSKSLNESEILFLAGRTPDYVQLHLTSKFCLAFHGYGYGMRLSLAMMYGCIPVIISRMLMQPLADILPYPDFSLRLSHADIPHLVEILRSVTPAQEARLRLGMAAHWQAFVWNPHHGGLAYNYTLRALHTRLHNMWGDLYR